MPKITKLLVANRSEIAIRVFRTAHELGIRTVAIYAHEDRYALHRFKADEAYLVGKQGEPIRAYLDIESIIETAKKNGVDGIHPGYGFLSENPELARACDRAGITFVGPKPEHLVKLGDKTFARNIAEEIGVPVLGGSKTALNTVPEAKAFAEKVGFPIILKAAKGGGGRGMRVVQTPADFDANFEQAQRESLTAFGSPDIFIEKFVGKASHIEVQILGDKHGSLVHLWERDCSVQRRHQKVVEIAPAPNLDPGVRQALCDAALAIGRAVNYENAGTVEFLVDRDTNQFFFIEVNPRIQVEHTVTEEVTGIDVVKSQILVAQGLKLSDPEIGLGSQEAIQTTGFAIQCRVTTEDPSNAFMPDYGRIAHYRSAAGMGIRLDAGTAFSGAMVNPFYDSLLVKVTARGRRFEDAAKRMERCLQEFRIRGVKTNIPFLITLITHPQFLAGTCTTRFIDQTPELFTLVRRRNRATRLLTYLAEVMVNGNPLVKNLPKAKRRLPAPRPSVPNTAPPAGTRDKLKELGPEEFSKWILDQKRLLITDTTFRDAHQSLLATRFRTRDLLNIADAYSHHAADLFSLEMWGGATFDTSMRFLKEDPWQRLAQMREKCPNILFQMLFRASNAVGYASYPDNVVSEFCVEAAQAGMDIFRIFDSLNWTENLRVAMEAVLKAGAICEPAICYTGDILNPKRDKYSLQYYVKLAKELEKMGAHILAIKDMAGLCKPYAAAKLVQTLKQEVGVPIHFHTHDTAGIQAGAILRAADHNLDIADAAMAPMSGGTSQPNLNTIVEALRFTERDTGLCSDRLNELSDYWKAVREFYLPFDDAVLPAAADLYSHEMPGGQYTNLYQQARALGMESRWNDICRQYAEANQLLGDIVKVTPSSKAVGDLALMMVANNITREEIESGTRELSFPESIIDLVGGRMGQPPGGFPPNVVKKILKDRKQVIGRPGDGMPPADFTAAGEKVKTMIGREPTRREILSYLLYPKVYEEFVAHQRNYSDTSILPTPIFFYGQDPTEEIAVDIETGKTLIIKFLTISEPHADGTRTVFFELNGQPREATVDDKSLESTAARRVKAEKGNPKQVGSSMPGMVVTVLVNAGDTIGKGQKLFTLEAMKMETTITSDVEGKVKDVLVKPGSVVETDDLLLTVE